MKEPARSCPLRLGEASAAVATPVAKPAATPEATPVPGEGVPCLLGLMPRCTWLAATEVVAMAVPGWGLKVMLVGEGMMPLGSGDVS